jgi:predicted glycosyltransferase
MLHSPNPVRVWIDITNSPHVLVFRPLIALLRERGAEVEVTSRDYAQTVQLLELHGIDAEIIGRHGGGSAFGKAREMLSRMPALDRWARGRGFDVALAHGSHELTLTARRLGIPSSTTFDYEYAWLQHQLGCRAATRVVVPEAIPPERLRRYGVRTPKLGRYPGLKEEYYLADFEPDPRALEPFGLDPARVLVVIRTPPDVSLYHRHGNPLFREVLERVGRDESARGIVLPRTAEQRDAIRALGLPSLRVPEQAVDGQSLIAAADLVVSAGGTMNREAVALGVPVYTTFGGRLGGVDELLIREGRLRPLRDADDLALPKRERVHERVRRDPALLLDLLLPD